VFGLLVAGTLIGIIANGVEDRVDSMRRGRSVVIESGHLVVVGGTDRMAAVVHQLALANQARPQNTIVVLADRDPGELRQSVRGDLRGTRVVFRWGDPTRRADLEIVRPARARGIVVLRDGNSDAAAVKTVLAITAGLPDDHDIPVVVEVSDSQTAQRLLRACPDVHSIVPEEAVGRTAAFALRQPGISQVMSDLTDAAGNTNIHVVDAADAIGFPFATVVGRYENAIPIGTIDRDGTIELNPPPDRATLPGDRLVVVTSGPGDLEPARDDVPLQRSQRSTIPFGRSTEHLAVVGWSALGVQLLDGWGAATAEDSTVEIFYDPRQVGVGDISVADLGVETRLTALSDLADVLAGAQTTVIVLADRTLDADESDARTMLGVRTLQRLARGRADPPPRLVVELRDPDNAEVLELEGPGDYVVSTAIASQFVAQLVEQPERRRVLLEMYTPHGPSLRLVRCESLGLAGQHDFSEVAASVYGAGAIAIGWRTASSDGGQVVLGPSPSSTVTLAADDQIVIVG
jgi:ion channel POLLUX/CASTOR